MPSIITGILPGSPAHHSGVEAGETLVSVNGHEIMDFMDYRFYETDRTVRLLLERCGSLREVTVSKRTGEDLGLEFASYLMDERRCCRNKCIFCFIDQLPGGVRDSLRFKDDDSRLSFLFGNYITLTNLTEHEISRIISMRVSPVNISVHTTNPELRCRMMGNPHAGSALQIMERFAEGGVGMNVQLVLCPGINDGAELERTLHDFLEFGDAIESIAAVPVGLTAHRQKLTPLLPFDRKTAQSVIDIMGRAGDRYFAETGLRRVYPADEFFLKAGVPIPNSTYYEDFPQLENGVGMYALFREQFLTALDGLPPPETEPTAPPPQSCTILTGVLAYCLICELVRALENKRGKQICRVIPVENKFFGGEVCVAGLVTASDIIAAVSGQNLGDTVFIPDTMLQSQGNLFLDSVSLDDLRQTLSVNITPLPPDGAGLVAALWV